MTRKEILDAALTTVLQRNDNYGSPLTNHERIAVIWSVILDLDISPEQVALCMAGVKVARLIQTIDHVDSWVDLAGYAGCGGEIATRHEEQS